MTVQKQTGFTIPELIVTLTLLAIAVPALAGFISTLSAVNDRARDMATIQGLVENKIESLRSVSFSGLSDGTVTFTSELASTIASPRSASYTISTLNAALKQIDVTVSFNDHGTPRTLSYRTYMGELGVGQY
jgi:prepilin-type N-terminal cleavage/methylation domain-containing protein